MRLTYTEGWFDSQMCQTFPIGASLCHKLPNEPNGSEELQEFKHKPQLITSHFL